MEKVIEYAPIIIVVLMFFVQQKIFVTPEQLERKHRDILSDVDKKYVQCSAYNVFKEQILTELEDVKSGVNDIKDFLINHNH